MEGRFSSRDFESVDLEKSPSRDDAELSVRIFSFFIFSKYLSSPLQRQYSEALQEDEKISFSWSNLTVSVPRRSSRYLVLNTEN